MKKVFSIYILIACIGFTACEDLEFLEPKPEDRLTRELALGDLNGASGLVFRGYHRFHSNFNWYGQNFTLNGDALADNVDLLNNTGRYVGQLVNAARTTYNIYANAYQVINDENMALAVLPDLASEDPARAAVLEGQAKFARALAYFDLARVYGYEPGQEVSGFNLAVPVSPEAVFGTSNITELERSTNTEVYALVKADLQDAISLLPAEGSTASWPYLPSRTAAKAFLARVNLYEGSYATAAQLAEEVMSETGATLTDVTNHLASWSTAQHPEAIFSLNISGLDWGTVTGVNNSLATITNTNDPSRGLNSAQGVLRASVELLDAFEAGDIRRDLWENPTGPDNWEGRKWNGELGGFREHIPIMRYAEVLLIAAEGRARSGNGAAALTHLNTLRTSRGLAASTATGAALTTAIMNERRLEFVLEGHRFFDMKRTGSAIPKAAAQGGQALPYSDFRVLANIPEAALSNNSVLQQNPGY
jgi:hypothetical protein